MTVGERIKEVRKKTGMSQVDFADKINVSKQTLYKYENNLITNIPSDKIEAVAKVGRVSPAYLMGWEDISDGDIGNMFTNDNLFKTIDNISALSSQEKNHFHKYLQLLETNQKKADDYVEHLLSVQQMDTELQLNAAHTRTDIDIPENIDTTDNDIMDDENFENNFIMEELFYEI